MYSRIFIRLAAPLALTLLLPFAIGFEWPAALRWAILTTMTLSWLGFAWWTTRAQAHRDGYVETIFGRRLYLENLQSRNQAHRAGAERAAVNAPMQGSAADIIKRAMITVAAWLKERDDDAHMLMQVHDELVFEVRADAVEAVREGVRIRMQGAAELSVPLLVGIGVGTNWNEAH